MAEMAVVISATPDTRPCLHCTFLAGIPLFSFTYVRVIPINGSAGGMFLHEQRLFYEGLMRQSTTYLKDYQPVNFAVLSMDLEVALYEDVALVTNTMVLQRCHPGELRLSGDELELVNLQLDGRELLASEYGLDFQDLVITDCPDHFTLVLTTRLRPQENTKLSGLYRSQGMFCTQCEAEGFRRITYFYDRPDVLTLYTTRISADKTAYPVLLSNGNLIDSGDTDDGRHWVIWQDPFKKPSYLFALVAGQLDCFRDEFVTVSGKKVDLCLYVEPGKIDQCAHAMESLKRAMRWDEEKYGREYDLSILMIVAVSDFNSGAMENKGLNIFNDQYILARPDTATDSDYADVESVVGHEYFHNWTGNRVTCRDWFQLSLKEGLTVFREQEFAADMNARDVNRIVDVKILRSAQFPEDAGRMAHPVRPQSYQEISNFYTATIYNKGAEVIRMQHTLLGNKGFRAGMDLYFERHDGEAVTIDDFVAAMEDANGIDLTQFKRWYAQAGTPVVEVNSSFQDHRLTLSMTQTCPATPECEHKEPFYIPIRVALFDEQGKQLPLANDVLTLSERTQTFHFDTLSKEPTVSLLRGFSAPVKLKFPQEEKALLGILAYETDGFAKWEAAQNLATAALMKHYQQTTPAQQSAIHATSGAFSPFSGERQNAAILSSDLVNAYAQVLNDERLDLALRAELLSMPTYEQLANDIPQLNVSWLEDVRDKFQCELGIKLHALCLQIYERLWAQEDHQMHGQAYGRRQLRNLCLKLLMKADETNTLPWCEQQYYQAKTMTDQIASLALLTDSLDVNLREKTLDAFYRQWQHEDLVLDKWFAVQAMANRPDVLTEVRRLMASPKFNFKNPNRVRALVGRFCQANPRYFHAMDGKGYDFLTEILIQLDPLNPQLSARLATPFTRWAGLDTPRQQLIQQSLAHLAKQNLSHGLSEVVSKSLAT